MRPSIFAILLLTAYVDAASLRIPLRKYYNGYAPSSVAQRPTDSRVWKFEANIPAFLRSLLDVPEPASARTSHNRDLPNQKFSIQVTTPNWDSVMQTLEQLLRRSIESVYVEEGPGQSQTRTNPSGVFKSDTVVYPKNFHEANLKKLMKIKERMSH